VVARLFSLVDIHQLLGNSYGRDVDGVPQHDSEGLIIDVSFCPGNGIAEPALLLLSDEKYVGHIGDEPYMFQVFGLVCHL
jgi:hypothetical protein